MIKFLVKCPKCGKNQQTLIYKIIKNWTNNPVLNKKSKRCVYCGKSFPYKNQIIKKL